MPSGKLYLHGSCQEPGCSKRARHLRGKVEHYVFADRLVIKALCGEHTRAWDKCRENFLKNLPPSDPAHYFPSSVLKEDWEKAERLAAEQEAWELAKRRGQELPPTPTWDERQKLLTRQPKLVRLN